MADLTCTRCGVQDGAVKRRENGVPSHERPTHCIAALRDIVEGRRPRYEVTEAGRQVLHPGREVTSDA